MGYLTIDEWKLDMAILENNPNNDDLILSIAERMGKSSTDIQEEIREYVEFAVMDQNPVGYMKMVMRRLPDHEKYTLIIKSHDDPWFEV